MTVSFPRGVTYLKVKFHQVKPFSYNVPTELLRVFPICEVLVVRVYDDFEVILQGSVASAQCIMA